MDIQKEREAFESAMFKLADGQTKNEINLANGQYMYGVMEVMWKVWQAAKTQAVPEGFIVVPITPSDDFIDKLADVICDEFDTTIIGSAHCATQAYKLIVEAQE